jgi:hypothetical protein
MLPRIKSGVRVAPLLPSPTLRAVAAQCLASGLRHEASGGRAVWLERVGRACVIGADGLMTEAAGAAVGVGHAAPPVRLSAALGAARREGHVVNKKRVYRLYQVTINLVDRGPRGRM